MDHLTFYCALFLLIFGYSTAANDSEEINECIIQSYSTAANNNEETNQSIKHVKEENCISVPGFYLPECDDINECWGNPKLCGAHTQCNNTVGGYKCVCESGFQTKLNKTEFCHNETYNTCEDINECDTNTHKCGANTKCKNTKGGYLCLCNPGYLKKNNTVKFTPTDNKEDNKCEVKCNGSDSGMKSSDLFQCFMDNLISSLAPSSNKVDHFQRIQQLLDELNGIIDRIPRRSIQERLRGTGKVLKQVERIVRNLSLSYGGNITAKSKNNRTELLTLSGSRKSKLISLQSRRSRLQVDPQTAAADSGDDFPFVGFLEYNSLAPLLEGAGIVGGSNSSTVHLISPVISTFLSRENTSSLNSSITFRLQHTAINITIDPSKTTCAFWSQEDVAWSTAGCITLESSKQETNCSCVHMTSFAILMATNNVEELVKSWPLTLITRIGLSISIICLSLSIITFIFCRSLRGTRNTIHTHLCISLFLGHCIFLLGITANHNLVACSVVAGLLHAFYLASFFWMSLEAVELYLMLVKVFNTHLKKRYLLLIGYGVPLAIVTISASVYPGGYGTKLHCWLSLERNFIWSFMGPVCMILLVNSGIFVLTVWKLAEKMSQINPEMEKYKRIRSLTVTAVAQLSILGCCWVFGFLQFGSTSLFFAYAFSILNMLQGLQIFIFHCLMNKKVRADYARWLCAIAHFKAPSYSEFSSNSQTQTRNKNTNKDSSL
ncbi:hypothetical protein XELAEV_18018944mg [Xenopus laevis]|uniref:Adhesion G protein-coupled receptor E5 n=1 Tax=Xenopus laevis TaxID=8355 RepID=A0A974HU42_XENLA|nr:hypothetical protein XELAEV_18018944mg [Xenopus laevis]